MTLKRNGYRKRVAEETLDRYLEAFGAVEIRGPKWCGKTWLALSRAESQARLDDRRLGRQRSSTGAWLSRALART